MSRFRGPAGVLAASIAVGAVAGLLATHAVLAAWTYRDAARRGLARPRAWALSVLVGGVVAFGPYLLASRGPADGSWAVAWGRLAWRASRGGVRFAWRAGRWLVRRRGANR